MRVLKRGFLGADPPLAQQRIEIDHLVGGLIHNLPGEEILDRRGTITDFQPLPPTAVDVIEEPLQGPQAANQAKSLLLLKPPLPSRLYDRLHGGAAALLTALLHEFLG